MMLYKEGISDFEPWSGAVATWETLDEYDKIEELEAHLDELCPEGMSETDLNDLLWHESESVYEWVGLHYNPYTGEVSDEPFPTCCYCDDIVSEDDMFTDKDGDAWCLKCKEKYYEDPDEDEEEEEED